MLAIKFVARAVLGCGIAAGATLASAFTFDGSEWLTNGNAEATGTGYYNNTIDPAFGWGISVAGASNNCTNPTIEVVNYANVWDMVDDAGVDGWTYSGPSEAIRGNNLLVGGAPRTGGDGGNWWFIGGYEDFWMWGNDAAIAEIDKGTVTYDFSGWFGGITPAVWSGSHAWAGATIQFSGTGATTTHFLGGTSSPFRAQNGTGDIWSQLAYTETSGLIPVGTRRIEVYLKFGHDGNGWGSAVPDYTYGAMDNVSLKVTQAVPEPGTMAVLGLGVVGLLARRRKK